MSKQVLYVGIDVGSKELWVSIKGAKSKMFCHTHKGIRSLHSWCNKKSDDQPIHFCMESTGVYSVNLATWLLEKYQAVVSIVNPARIAAFGRVKMKRSKTDSIDAELIRNYAETHPPQVWKPASRSFRQLTALVTHADAIRDSLNQWRNRHHAQNYITDLPNEVKKSQRAIERHLTTELKKVEAAIAELIAKDTKLSQQVALLCSIPGIADKSAAKLIGYGQNWLTETSAKALTAYAGLAPHHYQSGTSVYRKSRIDKRGNAKLRKTLFMPALVAIQHNHDLKKVYERLVENGKPKKLALVAVMRKLLIISRAILITEIPFRLQNDH